MNLSFINIQNLTTAYEHIQTNTCTIGYLH